MRWYEERGIGTYPVGILECLKHRRGLRSEVRRIARSARHGNWRAVRNSFNGYLAEWHFPPIDSAFNRPERCGRGWTRRAALRRLGMEIVRANLSDQERER